MSLINDALKTAQRERSGQTPSGPGQPLLDGFFPYVSTSTPEGRTGRTRVVLIAVSGLVVAVLALWLGLPMLKRATRGGPAKLSASAPLLSQTAVASTPPQVQSAPLQDTQPAAVTAPDPAPAGATDVDREQKSAGAKNRTTSSAAPRRVVATTDSGAPRRDSVIAQPAAVLPSVPDRTEEAPATARRNYEAEAVAAFNAGDYRTARERFALAVRTFPTASAWTNSGVTFERLGDQPSAIRAYRAAMAIDQNYFNAWLYLARLYNLLGDVTQATPLFLRAQTIEPNNSEVNADLAELEFKAGVFNESRRYADVATRSNPANARAHYYLALSADTLKDYSTARRAFEDYLRTIAGQEKDNLPSIGYARARLEWLKGKS